LQVKDNTTEEAKDLSVEDRIKAQKQLVEELKSQWKLLWNQQINDKVRAEDISSDNYDKLQVERGTVIKASRDYKPLNFRDILEEHVEKPENYIAPNVQVGGWTKFVKTEITGASQKHRRAQAYIPEKKAVQQPKKGGRGWLHKT
jgi:hypothetical protein